MYIEELQCLGTLWGPSGQEERVRNFLKKTLHAHHLNTTIDPLGSFSVQVGSGDKHLLVAAPLDQPFGFINALEPNGHLRISLQGPIVPLGFVGSVVEFASGLQGIVGAESLKNNALPEESDLFVALGEDIGAAPPASLGDLLVRRTPWLSDGIRITGSDLWCRGACAILLDICRSWPQDSSWTLDAVFIAHGILSGRGLSVALRNKSPHACLVLEGIPFIPGRAPGAGALLCLRDAAEAGDLTLGNRLEAIAASAGLPLTRVLSPIAHPLAAGAASAGTGIPWIHIGFAVENWGAPAELCFWKDMEAIIGLLKTFGESAVTHC